MFSFQMSHYLANRQVAGQEGISAAILSIIPFTLPFFRQKRQKINVYKSYTKPTVHSYCGPAPSEIKKIAQRGASAEIGRHDAAFHPHSKHFEYFGRNSFLSLYKSRFCYRKRREIDFLSRSSREKNSA